MRLNTEARNQPAVTSTSTDLAIISAIPAIVPAEFFKPNGADAVLSALKTEVRKVAATLDISTPAGREAIASLAYKVARSKTALDEQGKELVGAIKKQSGEIDAERKRMRDELDALKDEVRKPLTDWENAEKVRVACHEEALNILRNISLTPAESCADVAEHIEKATNLFAQREWEEFEKRALDAKNAVLFELGESLKSMQAKEAALLEAERLRAEAAERAIKEREEAAARAAKEAAERRAEEQARIAHEAAERERQRVENERIEAEARAKQAEAERIAAEERAARKLKEAEEQRIRESEQAEARRKLDAEAAERRRIADELAAVARLAEAQAEAKRVAEQAEARRIAEAEAAELAASAAAAKAERERYAAVEAERQRVAAQKKAEAEEAEKRARNRAHQGAIHREILEALALLNISDEAGKLIIAAIAKGTVPHISIQY